MPDPALPRRELFAQLPTTHEITHMWPVDDYLCALTDDGTCWVVDEHGTVITSFRRDQALQNTRLETGSCYVVSDDGSRLQKSNG